MGHGDTLCCNCPCASSGLGGGSRQGEVEGAAFWGWVLGFCTVPSIHGLGKSFGETELKAARSGQKGWDWDPRDTGLPRDPGARALPVPPSQQLTLPSGRSREVSPAAAAIFRKLARERNYTDEMITMLPSQGECGQVLCSEPPGWLRPHGEPEWAGRDWLVLWTARR